jgi:hypothetical protein
MATRSKARRGGPGKDAITLLEGDHTAVQRLFQRFEKLRKDENNGADKAELVKTICGELKIHTQIEEEIFYPAVRDAIDDDELMDEAEVEHTGAKETISHLDSMRPGDELYDATVSVLGEYVNHHIKEEEVRMFPKVRKSGLDMKTLGTQLVERKHELQGEVEMESESGEAGASEADMQHGRRRPARAEH